MTTKLIKPNAQLGKALIDAALEKTKKEVSDALLEEVRHMMLLADKQEHVAESLQRSAAALRRRLDAVEKGKFTVDERTRKVVYLDDEGDNIIYSDSFEFITRNIPNWIPKSEKG